jgi:hypothetical protein
MGAMRPARRCRLFAALGFVTLLGAVSPSPVAAQDGDGFPGRDDIADALRLKLAGEAIPLEQVILFSLAGDDLAITSELRGGEVDGDRPINVRGLPGATRVELGARFRGPMGLVPFFELNHTGPAGPEGKGTAQTRIFAQGESVRIDRTTRVGDVHTSVTFQQGPTFTRRGRIEQRGGGERVRLRVRTSQVAAPGLPVEESWEADSFAELLLRQPATAARHLLPMFREFGNQDAAVFRVDPRIGWQLFPDAVEADEDTAAKVLALVDRLDADHFRERELATAELEVLGGPAMVTLGELDRAPLSPEQNTRIDAILSRHSQLDPAEVVSLLDDPEFLLRCFCYCDVRPVRAAAATALSRKLGGANLGLDPAATLPDRVRAADKVREKLPEE